MNEPWPWPEELDAVTAAPDFHTVLYEDDRVRVLEGLVRPGVTVPLHTHRCGGVLYLLGSSDFVRRNKDGEIVVDTRTGGGAPARGSASWAGPLTPHTFENVGASDFHTLTVEMKDT
jgi:mannose-6-phosphate isomerase-like protein (cupin superfamily)